MGWTTGLSLAHVACQEIAKLKGASDADKVEAMRVVLWAASSGDAETYEFEADDNPLISEAAITQDRANRKVKVR